MKTAIATRFRCRRPLSDLTQLTLMFLTLILQYLNKLSERKVRDFASPEAFHTRKVQRLGRYEVKPSTKVRGKFVVPIFALVGNMSVEPCELMESTPPIIRPFNLTAQCFVEFAKFGQGLFQELWRLDLLTRVQCQISVFQTCLLYTSPSPRDRTRSRMPSSA